MDGARRLLIALLIGCGGPPPAHEASEALPRRELASARPAGCFAEGARLDDLSFAVRAARSSFRRGERIVLVLAFASRTPDAYQLDAAAYDRSGRLMLDRFDVSSEGTVDPLADYFGRMMGMAGGGLRSMPMLGPEPEEVERDLNEHVRFDAPGVYVVQVATDRVRRDAGAIECVAAPIELTILPAEEGNAAIESASRVLADSGASEEAQIEAARTLRYSPSERAMEASIEHLARSERSVVAFPLEFGLYGTPHRRAAVARMERALEEPELPIPARFVDALVSLGHWLEVPALGERPEDERAAAEWDARLAAQRARRLEREDAIAARLIEVLERKSAAARSITLATLIELGSRRPQPPAWYARLPAGPAQSLPTLPADAQVRLLRDEWLTIAGDAVVPALRHIADTPDPDDGTARVLALRRLIELRPDEGRARVEAALRQPEIDLGYSARDALLALPPDAFSDTLDEPLMAAVLRRDHQLVLRASLLSRYASPALAPRVRALLDAERDTLMYDAVGDLYAYLLRVDASRTAREIAAWARASTERRRRWRVALALDALDETGWDPALEPVAIELLNDEDHETVRSAASVLKRRGGDAAERALVERLRVLLAPWRGRARELESDIVRRDSPAGEVRGLRYALLDALLHARDRVPSIAALDAARAACVTDECREDVTRVRGDVERRPVSVYLTLHTSGQVDARFASHWDLSGDAVRVGEGRSGPRAFVIEGQPLRPAGAAPHRAEALDWLLGHVVRLPRGTEVTLAMWPEDGPEHDALMESLRGWLGAHGYVVQP